MSGPNSKESLRERIHNDFTYHTPPKGVTKDFVTLREKAKELALLIVELSPPGREQSSALTRLEETIMHANAGIARQYPAETQARSGAV
jgi:hypothetical protein